MRRITKYLSIILLFIALSAALFTTISFLLNLAADDVIDWQDIWTFMTQPTIAGATISIVSYLASKLLNRLGDEIEVDHVEQKIAISAHHALNDIQQIHHQMQGAIEHVDQLLHNANQLTVIVSPPHNPKGAQHYADVIVWLKANNKSEDAKTLLETLPMATFRQVQKILNSRKGAK